MRYGYPPLRVDLRGNPTALRIPRFMHTFFRGTARLKTDPDDLPIPDEYGCRQCR